eukprot:TRINITY_DN1229_c0_g1_i1.p1 TRINITY_DN1229_c0_g1~~TRINITY_DN1229_c0_g1_i1.p1  ORF type:complete len:763 (-),score=165.15 TRINITY_DN1229_c0_g1_i1:4347-6635(-)
MQRGDSYGAPKFGSLGNNRSNNAMPDLGLSSISNNHSAASPNSLSPRAGNSLIPPHAYKFEGQQQQMGGFMSGYPSPRSYSEFWSVNPSSMGGQNRGLPEELYRLADPSANVLLPPPGSINPSSLDNRELDKLMGNLGKNKATWRRVLLLHEWLVAMGHKPDNRLCTTLIRVCSQHGQAQTALSIYEWMKKPVIEGGAGLQCTVYTYTAAMRAALGGSILERALQIWEDSQMSGVQSDARLCTVYIEVCSRLNRIQDALQMYANMLNSARDGPLAPTVHAFTAAMRAATEGGHWEMALEIWNDMERYGCQPTGHAYAAAISACAAGSQWVTAVKLFEDMISNDIKPDVVSCTALITALATHGEWQRAEKVVQWMLKTGVNPNVRTYTALVTAMGNAQCWDKAINVIQNMQRPDYGNITPNAYTYSALLKSLGEHGECLLAEQVFAELENDQITYLQQTALSLGFQTNILSMLEPLAGEKTISSLSSPVNSEQTLPEVETATAQSILRDAIVSDPSLLQSPQVIQSLQQFQGNQNGPVNMLTHFIGMDYNTLKAMASKRRNSPVNEVVCSALMLAYERAGKWEECIKVLSRARNMGVDPNVVMYNTALSAAGKASRVDIIANLFLEMPEPDATSFETLIAAYGTAGDAAKAEEVYQSMVSKGYIPREYAYCGLIAAYSSAGDLKTAIEVSKRMQASGLQLTLLVYNSMIAACQNCKDYEKAKEIFQAMSINGVEPNAITQELMLAINQDTATKDTPPNTAQAE